jgi:hypothetical protein
MRAHAVEVERENADGLGKFVWSFRYDQYAGRLSLYRFTRLMRATRRHKFKPTGVWHSDPARRNMGIDFWNVPKLERTDVGLSSEIAYNARDVWVREMLAGGVEGIT